MHRSAIAFVLCFVAAFSAYSQSISRLLDSAVNVYFQQKNFNGSVLVAQKGKIILEKGYGYKDVASKTKSALCLSDRSSRSKQA